MSILKYAKNRNSHGKRYSRLYSIHSSMIQRCYNKNHVYYNNYGGRGIQICNEWLTNFENFYTWSINNGYQENLTIDRIDNNGNYSPDNCRWITKEEQNKNRRSNHNISYKGETHNITEWAIKLGISKSTFEKRIYKGLTGDKLFAPINKNLSRIQKN